MILRKINACMLSECGMQVSLWELCPIPPGRHRGWFGLLHVQLDQQRSQTEVGGSGRFADSPDSDSGSIGAVRGEQVRL